jgi:hypothetical protein
VCFSDLTSTGLKSQCWAPTSYFCLEQRTLNLNAWESIPSPRTPPEGPGTVFCSISDPWEKFPSGLPFVLPWQIWNSKVGELHLISKIFPSCLCFNQYYKDLCQIFTFFSNWLQNVDKLTFWWAKALSMSYESFLLTLWSSLHLFFLFLFWFLIELGFELKTSCLSSGALLQLILLCLF